MVWQPVEHAERYSVMLVPFGENANSTSDSIPTVMKETEKSQAVLTDVMNDVHYEVQINTFCGGKRDGKALSRWVRCHGVPGSLVSFIHQDDHSFSYSGSSTCSQFLIRLPSGALLASHNVYWRVDGQNLIILVLSEDEGKTWYYLTDLCTCFWGRMIPCENVLYMMDMDAEYGNYLSVPLMTRAVLGSGPYAF